MKLINFQSEQPSSTDLFPGSSHERVASAIFQYITTDKTSCIIGLDGEFGSGKSSILKMLESKVKNQNNHFKIWVFDCEQNYQGSIKSNFIELFTEEVKNNLIACNEENKIPEVEKTRDTALGRHVEYTKSTISNVSPWAIALITSIFIASTFLKELLFVARTLNQQLFVMSLIYTPFILSPGIVFFLAWIFNKNKTIGRKKWSLLSIFKGNSEDHINETIEVSKDVTPLDLRRALMSHLSATDKTAYVLVIDNLDRLPKDALRSVWSDLEIFTSLSSEKDFRVIVPFCSNKISKYLGRDDNSYDAKDFISKKFPIVFRSPPVISSGWRDGFRKMWSESFGDELSSECDYCCVLLQRHTPMSDGMVTPRLQKRFINDIATTVLVVEENPNYLCIAAYILLCKYNSISIEQILKEGSEDKNLQQTKVLLSKLYGNEIETGWPIQFLQVHFQTSPNIAIAELLDEPLRNSLENIYEDRFIELTNLFGFMDGFKRVIEENLPRENILITLNSASSSLDPEVFKKIIHETNLRLLNDPGISEVKYDSEYLDAVKNLVDHGLNENIFNGKIDSLSKQFKAGLEVSYEDLKEDQFPVKEYDAYLYALNKSFSGEKVSCAEVIYHSVSAIEDLKVISLDKITLTPEGIKSAVRQICSSTNLDLSLSTLPDSQWQHALMHAFGNKKLGETNKDYYLSAEEAVSIQKIIAINSDEERLWIALAFSSKLPSNIETTISPFTDSNSETIRAAIAIIGIRQKTYTLINKITDIEMILESSVFNVLCRAVLSSDNLFSALKTDIVGPIIAPVSAKLIRSKSISTLYSSQIVDHFKAIVNALEPYQLSELDVFDWIDEGWEKLTYSPEIEKIDTTLVPLILSRSNGSFLSLKEKILLVFTNDTTHENWIDFFNEESNNKIHLLRYMMQHRILIKSKSIARDCYLQVLIEILADPQLDEAMIEKFHLVSMCLDENAKLVLGANIRSLVLAEGTSPNAASLIIGIAGELIPDAQPANIAEAGRLLAIFEYIHDNPGETQATANFYNSRAEQICRFNISKDLKAGFVSIVSKMEYRMPKLYESLSEKRGFKMFFKKMLNKHAPEKTASTEDQLS